MCAFGEDTIEAVALPSPNLPLSAFEPHPQHNKPPGPSEPRRPEKGPNSCTGWRSWLVWCGVLPCGWEADFLELRRPTCSDKVIGAPLAGYVAESAPAATS